ncbi:hypothetical protein AMECASPLE_037884 [Ameca splendens]|uniref:Uncharacterized protein n=1 Tax=Ameca splendens TaxID=208324 RepID=A0ABV0Z7P9_9TELE
MSCILILSPLSPLCLLPMLIYLFHLYPLLSHVWHRHPQSPLSALCLPPLLIYLKLPPQSLLHTIDHQLQLTQLSCHLSFQRLSSQDRAGEERATAY